MVALPGKIADNAPIDSRVIQNKSSWLSLLLLLPKVMEGRLDDNLSRNLEFNGLLASAKHGFRKGRSCVASLLDAADCQTNKTDDDIAVSVLAQDFAGV
ncbi:hypothetical protein P879_04951 [Paragonimus westermani]|uniref:Reverse transcriptase domain-containing protein n=1 Tax=Paragonimus westermani TaxID=34504 RepID=A0A8T0DKW1_9TREM|nr:hypothetical protein P879_04951 [Paragonimus westermani]